MSVKNKEKHFWCKGLRFSCTSCGHCCRHAPGYVFLSMEDLEKLTGKTGLSCQVFVSKYCRTVDLGIASRLSLTETAENDCIFWDQGCTVYSARPLQCRTYPFWPMILSSVDEWKHESRECPGIGHGHMYSLEEINAALRKRECDALISPF